MLEELLFNEKLSKDHILYLVQQIQHNNGCIKRAAHRGRDLK
jgi:hypothetical protein